jgi:hypothetical protein
MVGNGFPHIVLLAAYPEANSPAAALQNTPAEMP